jgi:ureidoacrylate peracid hydrolase
MTESAERPFSEHRQQVEATLDLDRSAVLVVDMLNDFLEDGGKLTSAAGRAIYGPIQQLLAAAQGAGVKVIWLCDEHEPGDPEFQKHGPHCLKGSWGAQIVDALRPGSGDIVMPKSTYNGFFRTPLHETLQRLGVDTLIVTGVATNVCVRSTCHDAFFLGYNVLVPEQCISTASAREQASSLYDIDTHYGTVTSLDRVLALLGQATTA